jgi:hypothetical protein
VQQLNDLPTGQGFIHLEQKSGSMKKITRIFLVLLILVIAGRGSIWAQTDSTQPKNYRNIIRYNLSGPLLFGFGNVIVVGYERVLKNNQSFSFNLGRAAIPKLISIVTDSSVYLQRDSKNAGFNFSFDYRFYLTKENKYAPPHGLYIGPYYSYNHFTRENDISLKRSNGNTDLVKTNSDFTIMSLGAEMGYQFVLWKRLALDMLLIGPGVGSYHVNAKLTGNVDAKDKEKLNGVIKDVLTKRFPGLGSVLEDKQISSDGKLQSWNLGFRYVIHVGFLF